jgi:two-component system cell cycle response regulator
MVTSRIILRCKLSAACYNVCQADGPADLRQLIQKKDVFAAILDGGGDPAGFRQRLLDAGITGPSSPCPVILLVDSADPATRLAGLAAGADAVLARPVDEALLLATLRRLRRRTAGDAELLARAGVTGGLGFADRAEGFASPARVCVVPMTLSTGARLALRKRHLAQLCQRLPGDLLADDCGSDGVVLVASLAEAQAALRLIPELKARAATRDTAILFVTDPAPSDPSAAAAAQTGQLAAMALDLGADDVILGPALPEEIGLRVSRLLSRKAAMDTMRRRIDTGLRLAARDPLTGLYNRRVALPRLDEMLAETAADGRALAVMLVDLDRFKRVNDTFGHATGDRVLTEAAARLASTAGPCDLVARIGGEEFLLVLPGAPLPAAARAAARVSAALRDLPITDPAAPGGIRITASIGLAVRERPRDVTAAELVAEADRAMLIAKSDGRDQITVARTAA